MTDPVHETVEGLLDQARSLFQQGTDELRRGLGRHVDEDDMRRLYRANALFTGATTAARIGHAMNGVHHLDMLREFEARTDDRTENGQAAFPCPDCDYVAAAPPSLARHLTVEHGSRRPYEPPTLAGPHQLLPDGQ